ncbi:hypothetical protein HOY80DRAFT_1020527 [Tuber brumale]|nr:hypothetical protein HOY80DRAFT_1020527 [Tuber brumale]
MPRYVTIVPGIPHSLPSRLTILLSNSIRVGRQTDAERSTNQTLSPLSSDIVPCRNRYPCAKMLPSDPANSSKEADLPRGQKLFNTPNAERCRLRGRNCPHTPPTPQPCDARLATSPRHLSVPRTTPIMRQHPTLAAHRPFRYMNSWLRYGMVSCSLVSMPGLVAAGRLSAQLHFPGAAPCEQSDLSDFNFQPKPDHIMNWVQ